MVDPGEESDPYRLAEMELSEKKIPFIVRRYLPDGSYEDWKVNELYVEWTSFKWMLINLSCLYYFKMLVPDTDQSIDTDIEERKFKPYRGMKSEIVSDEETQEPEMEELDIRNTVLQGSFLPVCLVASRRAFPLNSFIFD